MLEILQLIAILLPVTERLLIEGGKVVATMRQDLTLEELREAIERSKSINWPDLTFKKE